MESKEKIKSDLFIKELNKLRRRQKRLLWISIITFILTIASSIFLLFWFRDDLSNWKLILAITGAVTAFIPFILSAFKSRHESEQILTLLGDIKKSENDEEKVNLLVNDLIKKINA